MLVILAQSFSPVSVLSRFKQIPIDAFPDVTNVQVQVLATAGGMSPPEVEKLVTRPIEIQMGGLPRTEEIRSVSKIGSLLSQSCSKMGWTITSPGSLYL